MANPNGQNPFPGYGQPPQGFGGYPNSGPAPFPPHMAPPGPGAVPAIPRLGGGRRGTSKALPIIVSVGLAIGVFGGLLIVRGTGKSDAATSSSSTGGEGKTETAASNTSAPATYDASVAAAAATDAAPAAAATRAVSIILDVQPPSAKVSIDGKVLTSDRYRVQLAEGQSKPISIEVTATGYTSEKRSYVIEKDDKISIVLNKAATAVNTAEKEDKGSSKSSSSSKDGSSSSKSTKEIRKPRRPANSGSLIDL